MPNKNCEVYFVKVFAQSLTYREQRSGGRHRRYEVICGGTLRGLAVGTGVVRISGVAVTNFQLHRHQFSPSPRNVQLLAHKVKFTQLSEVPQRSAFKTIQFRVINLLSSESRNSYKSDSSQMTEKKEIKISKRSLLSTKENTTMMTHHFKLHRRWRRRRFGDALLKEFLANRYKKA